MLQWLDFNEILTNEPGNNTWPISGATFILLHSTMDDKNRALGMLKFFDWCYNNGSEIALQLDYAPIPKSFFSVIENAWTKQIKDKNNQKIWSGNTK